MNISVTEIKTIVVNFHLELRDESNLYLFSQFLLLLVVGCLEKATETRCIHADKWIKRYYLILFENNVTETQRTTEKTFTEKMHLKMELMVVGDNNKKRKTSHAQNDKQQRWRR